MTWDGCERRSAVRMSAVERAAWFAALEAEISDDEVRARDIARMNLLALLQNMAFNRPTRGTK